MSSDGLQEKILARAREEGAAVAGIVRIADLRNAPSYPAYDADPFYPEYKGWSGRTSSSPCWSGGWPIPAAEPVLDWWSLKVKGFTPGNRELAAQSKRLRTWMNDELGMGALLAAVPDRVRRRLSQGRRGARRPGRDRQEQPRGHPEYGPRIRWRGIFMEADLEPTGPLQGFDPVPRAAPSRAGRRVPRTRSPAARSSALCASSGRTSSTWTSRSWTARCSASRRPSNVTEYCRVCELACPVAPDYSHDDVAGAEEAITSADQTAFVLARRPVGRLHGAPRGQVGRDPGARRGRGAQRRPPPTSAPWRPPTTWPASPAASRPWTRSSRSAPWRSSAPARRACWRATAGRSPTSA